MLMIAGAVLVAAAVVGGYLIEGGHILVLNQPAEFLIIGGAAAGNLLISTPPRVLKLMLEQVKASLKDGAGRAEYLDLLTMLYQIFRVVQQSGAMALEAHFEDPARSAIMSKHPAFLARTHAVEFLADSAKVMIVGGIAAHDLEALMDEDLHAKHEEALRPSTALGRIADALPGLGIVAAVLGVVITMGAIDGPASEIGHKVGAALVGTFLGVLLSYGFVQPLSSNLEQRVQHDGHYEQSIKAGVLAVYKGMPPAIAIEFARRALPEEVRPSFDETEQACRGTRQPDGKADAHQAAA